MLNIPTQGDGSAGNVGASAVPGAVLGKPSLRLHRVCNSAQAIALPDPAATDATLQAARDLQAAEQRQAGACCVIL